ncbi:hypothetical protein Tco_0089965 [Tanacetum coccineum]
MFDPHGFEGILKDGGEVKEFQRSFRHSDTERLSRSDEVLKLKNFKKDATLKLSNQQIKNGMSMSVQKSQDHKMTKSQDGKRDYAWLMISQVLKITSPLTSKDKGTSSSLKSKITTTYSQEKVKFTS